MANCGECNFGVYFTRCFATREINTIIIPSWAHQQFVTRVNASFYLLHDITNPYITIKKAIFTHRLTFCWWRHNWLLMTSQWPDNCDAITWIMISNTFDIVFFTAIFAGGKNIIYFTLHNPSKDQNIFESSQWKWQQVGRYISIREECAFSKTVW